MAIASCSRIACATSSSRPICWSSEARGIAKPSISSKRRSSGRCLPSQAAIGRTAEAEAAKAAEEAEAEEEEAAQATAAPKAESGRWHVLRALLSGHTEREDVVSFVEEQSDFGADTRDGTRHAVLRLLRTEGSRFRVPLWTQDGTVSTLTAAGEALRGSEGLDDLGLDDLQEAGDEAEEEDFQVRGQRRVLLRALVAGHHERDDVVAVLMRHSSIGAGTSSGSRAAIVTLLGKEKQQRTPLWTQQDSAYALTPAGEALRSSLSSEEVAEALEATEATEAAKPANAVASVAPPRVAESIVDANDAFTRFRVRWAGHPPSAATWEPLRRLDAALVDAFITGRQMAFNKTIEPLLSHPGTSGVVAVLVPAEAAHACALHLSEHWVEGRLQLAHGKEAHGYSSYSKTLSAHDEGQQASTTLLMTNALLPAVRVGLPGFAEIEEHLVGWLHETYGTVVELFYAHGLRQSAETLRSTGFSVHQDTEDYDFIEYAHRLSHPPPLLLMRVEKSSLRSLMRLQLIAPLLLLAGTPSSSS